MRAALSPRIARSPDAGVSMIETLVVLLVGGSLLAAFTGFYLSEQRTFRRQQVAVETSQSLRVAIEQIIRDLRVAGRNPTAAVVSPAIGLTYASADEVRFTLDADGDGAITATSLDESKGFRRSGTLIESFVAGSLAPWQTLADWIRPSGTIFRYYRADGSEVTALPASTADLAAIRRIDVFLSVTRPAPGGFTIDRTESATARLRNLS